MASVEFWDRFVDYVLMTIEATIDNITMENYALIILIGNIFSQDHLLNYAFRVV